MRISRQDTPGKLSAIALSSNIGDSYKILTAAIETLAATPAIKVQAQSSWYRTKAVRPPQPDYLNGCAIFQVQMSPFSQSGRPPRQA